MLEDDLIVTEVLRFRATQNRIGTRKLYQEMQPFFKAHNIRVGRDALFTLLAQRGLLIRSRRRRAPITTHSWHRYKKFPNLIKGFVPSAPNQLWVSDITYVNVGRLYAYLSLITDAYSRKIVGYCLSSDLSVKGPLKALKMALHENSDRKELIHHSDRGVQYCSDSYIHLLTCPENKIKISMTEKGDPLENAIAERVNGILKQEFFKEYYTDFNTAEGEIANSIRIYNHQRPHSSIDYLKPAYAHLLTGKLKRHWKNYYKKPIGKEELNE